MAAATPKRTFTREDFPTLKVAVVHYWFMSWRGGEKVVHSLLKLFPEADVYTLFFDEKECGSYLSSHTVRDSCLNRPFLRKHYQKLFPLYPLGVGSLRLKRKYDLIISSESGPAKGVKNPGGTPHLCYIHTPMRYCWGFTEAYLESLPAWSRNIVGRQFRKLAKWDLTTVDNVDLYVANSRNVAERVGKFYGRNSEVCHPPVDLSWFEDPPAVSKTGPQGYYLSFGAITPYKNIGMLMETFNGLKEKLVIIGDGDQRARMERVAGDNISFKGKLPLEQVVPYIRGCRALIFPGEEDFGLVPLEVMSQGKPVIALGKGGALETVAENRSDVSGSSGLFFPEPTVQDLRRALKDFENVENRFDPLWIRNQARKFGEDHFHRAIGEHVLNLLNARSSAD